MSLCNKGLVLFILLLINRASFAQPARNTDASGAATGAVQGVVLDKNSKEPVPFASVTLHRSSDTALVDGVLTADKGEFLMERVKPGSYRLKINFIGYKPVVTDAFTIPASAAYQFGKVFVEPDVKNLDEVEVTGERSAMQLDMDKKVFT